MEMHHHHHVLPVSTRPSRHPLGELVVLMTPGEVWIRLCLQEDVNYIGGKTSDLCNLVSRPLG